MIKATELFNIDMTAEEASVVFFREYRKCNNAKELEELKAAFDSISHVLLVKESAKAMQGWT